VPQRYSDGMIARAAVRLGCLPLLLVVMVTGCSRGTGQYREYPLHGQILAIGAARPDGRREVSVRHDDIPGFMPAMTMAYFVKKPAVLDGLGTGDVVNATLVVNGSELYLDRLVKIGHGDVPAGVKPVKAMDVMEPGDVVPDDELQDQQGRPRKLSDWRGRALAVTFVYTRCPLPDFCPLMDRHFAELQRTVQSDPALRDRVHLVSVTFDPAHDTLDVIAAHAKARGADPQTWSYLTGPPAAIEHFTSRFGVSAIADADPAGTITHNLRTAVVDRRGRLVKVYSGNEWRVDELLADLRDAARR
jgi:protein SCO1